MQCTARDGRAIARTTMLLLLPSYDTHFIQSDVIYEHNLDSSQTDC